MNPHSKTTKIGISSIATCALFILAGNLIFVEQTNSSLVPLDSLHISYTSSTNSNPDSVNPDAVKKTSENLVEQKKLPSKHQQKIVGFRRNFGKLNNSTLQDTMLSLEGDYFPLFKLKPNYPQRALEVGYEGTCLVEYTIEKNGSVSNVNVIESECSGWFRRASISAANSFVYKPRIVNGTPEVVTNVRNKFVFKIVNR